MLIPFNEWMKLYREIASLLNIDYHSDLEASLILSKILGKHCLSKEVLKNLIRGKTVLIFNPGPSIDGYRSIMYRLQRTRIETIIVGVDGATKFLVENNVYPDIVVTDLDGDLEFITRSGLNGSFIIVHGHGDNIDKLREYVPYLLEQGVKVIGSTQVEPRNCIYNYGGFTDGDRAVFFALNYRPRRIILFGMDFGYRIGRYSKDLGDDPIGLYRKLVKLDIAYKLLSYIACRVDTPIYSLSEIVPECIIKINEYFLPPMLK